MKLFLLVVLMLIASQSRKIITKHIKEDQQNSDQIEQVNDANAQNQVKPILPIVLEEQIQQPQSIEINSQDETQLKEELQQEQIHESEVLIQQETEPQLEKQIEDITTTSLDDQYLESQKVKAVEQVVNQHQVIHQDTQQVDEIINQQDLDLEIQIENTEDNSQQTYQTKIQQTDEQIQVQKNIPENQEQPITKDPKDVVIEDNINATKIVQEQLEIQENESIIENNNNIQNQDDNQQQEQKQSQKNEEIIVTFDEQLNQQSEQISNQNLSQEINEDIQIIPEQIREENQDQIPKILEQEQQNEINNDGQNDDQIQIEIQQDQENILIDPYANNWCLNHDHTQHINNEILHNQFKNENDNNPTDPDNSISPQPSCPFDNKLPCSGDTHIQYSAGIETENKPLDQEEWLQYLLAHSYLQYYTISTMYFFGILALFFLVILKNLVIWKQAPYLVTIINEDNGDNRDNSQLLFQINQLEMTTLSEINSKLDTLTKSYQKMQNDHQLINEIMNDLQKKVLANLAGVKQQRQQTQVKPQQRPTTPILRQY